jgi:uncharacterized protein (DUF1697 family)
MSAKRYVALLRGINVGGHNPVPMADLRKAFEDAGYNDVATYIQSGNVVFATNAPAKSLEDEIEAMLEQRFGYPLVVVVRSEAQLRSTVKKAPAGFGKSPDEYHSDVIFLKSPMTPARVMEVVKLRDGVDQVWSGTGALYFARLSARRTESRLNKIMGTPAYKLMTIRNWATTTKLLGMLDAAGDA